jgi:excinuclease ABC subunit C
MLPDFINKALLPHKPGVYIYKNLDGQVIYVGKAIDLYHRVASYFNKADQTIKTQALVENIRSVETIIVESELEALILEANLIKQYLPQFNVRLTDDKDYLYILVTKEDFPRVITARKYDLNQALKYFGPFPSSKTVKETLKRLRRVFPWCANPNNKYKRACFYRHLNLCPGACNGEISKSSYNQIIKNFIKFMEGRKTELVDELSQEMANLSKKQSFEEAAGLKKTIAGIFYLTQTNRTQSYLENPNFLEDQRQIALEELQKALGLNKLPQRVECYDISNIQGHESTGSMVVLTNGEIDKSQYRKFKIKITGRPNDVGMHKEMLNRRLKHIEWPYPDVFIIDGGLGQVNGDLEILQENNVDIPIFGLAKRFEWLYSPDGQVIKLPKSSGALKLVIKIRDEAHRFAITYHRKLHRDKVISPSLRSG